MGVEVTYFGKSSILASICYYAQLDAAYTPSDHAEVVALLKANLQPKRREPAIQYGYYMKTYRKAFKHFGSTGVFSGSFNGVEIKPGFLFRFAILALGRTQNGFYLGLKVIKKSRNLLASVFKTYFESQKAANR